MRNVGPIPGPPSRRFTLF